MGAEVQPGGGGGGGGGGAGRDGVHFRVWAPAWDRIDVVVEAPAPEVVPLAREEGGYFAGFCPGLGPGARYRYRLGGADGPVVADPAARFQPDGPFGPSEVIDPDRFAWSDHDWRGIEPHRHVFYELHVGTFTPAGTWRAAAARLPELAELGVTTIEMMPVADFPGRFGWGYDGVCLFAPTRLYGRPDDLRALVDRAHQLGLAVVLDVVYNHLGPSGSVLVQLAPAYCRARNGTEWGDSINVDGPDAGPVRELLVSNAGYWVREYHLDGYRLDATHAMRDDSGEHVVTAVVRAAREAGGGRRILVVAEDDDQCAEQLEPASRGGRGVDAMWNDDFHHSVRVALTGATEGYFRGYRGTAQELLSAIKRGFLYQGQVVAAEARRRGSPARGAAPGRFVHFLQNHDQVANSGYGERLALLTDPGRVRALTALLLLSPNLPLLFQGQEVGSRRPWRFFADHDGELGRAVARGRADLMARFAALATPEGRAGLVDPADPEGMRACVLDPAARATGDGRALWLLHRDLLRLRHGEPVFTDQRAGAIDGAVLAREALALRFFGVADDGLGDRLLLVNLGPILAGAAMAEPLVAPPRGARWVTAWSSEDPRYGGHGTPGVFTDQGLRLGAHAAVLARAETMSSSVGHRPHRH